MTNCTNSRPAVTIDWRNAPAGARWWSVTRDGKAQWHIMGVCAEPLAFLMATTWPAPTFGYQGDWRESLVERPAMDLPPLRHCLLAAESQCQFG